MYLDSAIIVKLLVRETDSDWFNENLSGHPFEASELALAEVRSALLAKERGGHITLRERNSANGKFLDIVEDGLIHMLPLNRRVIERAIAMQLACHPRIPLRTLDALHVATADLHKCDMLSTTDGRMRLACEQFAIALFPARMEDISIAR